ncbi:VOC family protein [Actinacidiphila yeochonensis]|uniref:VOC family protein n=1 Tax=Actinacidiphila yeochonensis TaxID=89050 RepID=UPI00055C217E|nr:VOC family protein [Actinacidiphila yeochonensis]
MTEFAEGRPCWAVATFPDVEAGKRFYSDVLGWSWGEPASEYGGYTEARSDGKAVAAVTPPMPGEEVNAAWCLYLATPDAAASAAKAKDAGGELVLEPMRVGPFGTMALVKEPGGAGFGLWQADQHHGFEKQAEDGAYGWAEFFTRDPKATDSFLTSVFPYRGQKMADEHVDFAVFSVGDPGEPVVGRMRMGEEFPAEVPAYVNVYFVVPDCDAAVKTAQGAGAALRFGPMTSPFGRFAALSDPQGANFTVIDVSTKEGAMPELNDL